MIKEKNPYLQRDKELHLTSFQKSCKQEDSGVKYLKW